MKAGFSRLGGSMFMLRIIVAVLTFVFVAAGPAAAQSVYVAGAVGADISLVSGQQSAGFSVPTGGGEAVSGAARIGVVLSDRFGIELEVSRAGEIRNTSQPGVQVPLAGVAPFVLAEVEFRTQVTTISTSASIRQQLSDAVALAFLGGIVFHRTDSEMMFRGRRFVSGIYNIPPMPLPAGFDIITSNASFILPPSGVESVQYGAGPLVGVEVHIGVGQHLKVTPGVRMHGLPASWLLRPAVAVGWTF